MVVSLFLSFGVGMLYLWNQREEELFAKCHTKMGVLSLKSHNFIIVIDFWSFCFWINRNFFYIFVREYAQYCVLIHEEMDMFAHVVRRMYNPQ
jgi:hypothetical protein